MKENEWNHVYVYIYTERENGKSEVKNKCKYGGQIQNVLEWKRSSNSSYILRKYQTDLRMAISHIVESESSAITCVIYNKYSILHPFCLLISHRINWKKKWYTVKNCTIIKNCITYLFIQRFLKESWYICIIDKNSRDFYREKNKEFK